MMLTKLTLIAIICYASFKNVTASDYWEKRQNILDLENQMEVGSSIILNEKETVANEIIHAHKLQELEEGFKDPGNFLPALNFLETRHKIQEKPVFQVLEKLPKGALLHSHVECAASGDYIYNLSYSENLYACVDSEKKIKFRFSTTEIYDTSCNDWKLVNESRKTSEDFDTFIKSQLSLTDSNGEVFENINTVWKKLEESLDAFSGIILYLPVFKAFMYQVLQEIYDDNVIYYEFRTVLPTLYDDHNTTYTSLETAKFMVDAIEEFKTNNPGFYGAKIIYAPPRKVDNVTMNNYLETALKLQHLYPNHIAGFDLVGQEDLGFPLSTFIPQLLEVSGKIKFFFHAAETDWNGHSTDLNIVDAVLLNTTRIGHGYGILKHPEIMRLVKERGIALEISPISNQVLKLVEDIRNHPGVILLNNGFPVVISNDDPGLWGARGLSYDWYVAYVGMASSWSDLRFLKQLALNSINYSALSEKERIEVTAIWEKDWEKFIDDVIKSNM